MNPFDGLATTRQLGLLLSARHPFPIRVTQSNELPAMEKLSVVFDSLFLVKPLANGAAKRSQE